MSAVTGSVKAFGAHFKLQLLEFLHILSLLSHSQHSRSQHSCQHPNPPLQENHFRSSTKTALHLSVESFSTPSTLTRRGISSLCLSFAQTAICMHMLAIPFHLQVLFLAQIYYTNETQKTFIFCVLQLMDSQKVQSWSIKWLIFVRQVVEFYENCCSSVPFHKIVFLGNLLFPSRYILRSPVTASQRLIYSMHYQHQYCKRFLALSMLKRLHFLFLQISASSFWAVALISTRQCLHLSELGNFRLRFQSLSSRSSLSNSHSYWQVGHIQIFACCSKSTLRTIWVNPGRHFAVSPRMTWGMLRFTSIHLVKLMESLKHAAFTIVEYRGMTQAALSRLPEMKLAVQAIKKSAQ